MFKVAKGPDVFKARLSETSCMGLSLSVQNVARKNHSSTGFEPDCKCTHKLGAIPDSGTNGASAAPKLGVMCQVAVANCSTQHNTLRLGLGDKSAHLHDTVIGLGDHCLKPHQSSLPDWADWRRTGASFFAFRHLDRCVVFRRPRRGRIAFAERAHEADIRLRGWCGDGGGAEFCCCACCSDSLASRCRRALSCNVLSTLCGCCFHRGTGGKGDGLGGSDWGGRLLRDPAAARRRRRWCLRGPLGLARDGAGRRNGH
mmetsp:Transcript_108021/g.344906  ORF Transcript_108021/g.344906 Transcript_108021/m.344906 type:complete len:257 (-) Transcript_108021:1191-1961(-)